MEDDKKKILLTQIQNDYDSAHNARSDSWKQVKDNRRMYNREFTQETKDKHGGNLHYDPKVYATCLRAHASIVNTYAYNRNEVVKVSPRNTEHSSDPAESAIVQKYTNTIMKDDVNFYGVLSDIAQNAIVDGKVWCRLWWEDQEQEVEATVVGEDGYCRKEKHNVVVDGKFSLSVIPFEEIYPDPLARKWQDLRFVIRERTVSLGYLVEEENKGRFKNVKNVLAENHTDVSGNSNLLRQNVKIREYVGFSSLLDNSETSSAIDENIDRVKEQVIYAVVWENKQVLLEPRPVPFHRPDGTPFIPYFWGVIIKKQNSAVGIGLPDPISDLQAERNGLLNQYSKGVGLANVKRFVCEPSCGVNDDSIKTWIENGGVLTVKEGSSARIREFNTVPPSAQTLQKLQENDNAIQMATGITPYNSGVQVPGMNKTASGVSMLLGESNQIVNLYLSTLNETLLQPLIQAILWIASEHEFSHRIAKIFDLQGNANEKWRDAFSRKYSFNFETGAGATSRELQIQNLSQLIERATSCLQAHPLVGVLLFSLYRKLFPLLGVFDQDAILERIQQMMEQSLQAPPPQQQIPSQGVANAG